MERKLSSLILLLTCACASDFSPTVAADSVDVEDPSAAPNEPDDGSAGDESEGDSDSGTTSGSDGPTTDAPQNPGPGEPCDPFAAFEGDAPCEGDPATPSVEYTCVPNRDPILETLEFRCVAVVDVQGDGTDLGDPCSDNGGSMFAGCLNSYCLSNENHPPIPSDDSCPLIWWSADDPNHVGANYYVSGCCSNFCDDTHLCGAGWTCERNEVPATLNGKEVGTCVWK